MHLVLVGLNHRTAPVAVREQLALEPAAAAALHRELVAAPGVAEAAVLSTCNRTEIYLVSVCASAGEAAGRGVLAAGEPFLQVRRDRAAAEHLFRVASGLDSMILGETQILGQVRDALARALEDGGAGRILSALFRHALHAGKRARTETAIGQQTLSTSTAAVSLARETLGGLDARTVAIVGTGTMATHAAEAMRNDGLAKLVVVSRSAARAIDTATAWGEAFPRIEVTTLGYLAGILPRVDAVITATTGPALDPSMFRTIAPRPTPLPVIDIGVPRNVDPAVGRLAGVQLFDIDDLRRVVAENLEERKGQIGPVEGIVGEELGAFSGWFEGLWVQPTLVGLRDRAEEIRAAELERALRRLGELSPRDRSTVEALTRSIVAKLLHEPTVRLKQHAGEGRGWHFAEVVRDLFALDATTNHEEAAEWLKQDPRQQQLAAR